MAIDRVTLRQVKRETAPAGRGKPDHVLPSFEVHFDGQLIGIVERAMITRERRTPGKRYVNARWRSPGWRYRIAGSERHRALGATSRWDAIDRLLCDIVNLPWAEREALAKSAKVEK